MHTNTRKYTIYSNTSNICFVCTFFRVCENGHFEHIRLTEYKQGVKSDLFHRKFQTHNTKTQSYPNIKQHAFCWCVWQTIRYGICRNSTRIRFGDNMLVISDAVKMSTKYHHKHEHKTIANAKDHSINIFVVKMHCILVATKYWLDLGDLWCCHCISHSSHCNHRSALAFLFYFFFLRTSAVDEIS